MGASTVISGRILATPAGSQPIVFYDGECAFCNGMVQFLARHNPAGNLSFAPLQSVTNTGMDKNNRPGDTLVLLEGNKTYEYSEAALNIARHLSYPWKALVVFKVIPAFIRDYIYKSIARKRYRIWRQKGVCSLDIKGTPHHFPG